jgi:hypothetical protein
VLVVIGERDAAPRRTAGEVGTSRGTHMRADSRPRGSSRIELGSASSRDRSYYGTGAVTAGSMLSLSSRTHGLNCQTPTCMPAPRTYGQWALTCSPYLPQRPPST